MNTSDENGTAVLDGKGVADETDSERGRGRSRQQDRCKYAPFFTRRGHQGRCCPPGEGAEAQERLMKRMAKSEKVAKRYAEKRAAASSEAELQSV